MSDKVCLPARLKVWWGIGTLPRTHLRLIGDKDRRMTSVPILSLAQPLPLMVLHPPVKSLLAVASIGVKYIIMTHKPFG